MGLIRYNNVDIFVDISDKVFTDGRNIASTRTEIENTIKRKAEFLYLFYSPRDQRVTIATEVHNYAAKADGTYGLELRNIPGYENYQRTITADYDGIVDANTGQLIGDFNLLNDPANFQAPTDGTNAGILYGIDYMYEFEWYKMIAATNPAIIDNMIIQAIQVADLNGKYV